MVEIWFIDNYKRDIIRILYQNWIKLPSRVHLYTLAPTSVITRVYCHVYVPHSVLGLSNRHASWPAARPTPNTRRILLSRSIIGPQVNSTVVVPGAKLSRQVLVVLDLSINLQPSPILCVGVC